MQNEKEKTCQEASQNRKINDITLDSNIEFADETKRNIVNSIIKIVLDNKLSINEAGDIFANTMRHLKNMRLTL